MSWGESEFFLRPNPDNLVAYAEAGNVRLVSRRGNACKHFQSCSRRRPALTEGHVHHLDNSAGNIRNICVSGRSRGKAFEEVIAEFRVRAGFVFGKPCFVGG